MVEGDSLKSACWLEGKSFSAEDVSRQPAECTERIKGGRMVPVATKLHQCAYLTPGRRMKRWQKLFFVVVVAVVVEAFFFFFFLAVFFNMKVWIIIIEKLLLATFAREEHVSTAASSLSSLAVLMPAVFVMTRVQSGGKLEPRRTGNWQIVFCPARIIISNTQRTSGANSDMRKLKDTPFITTSVSKNFTMSRILSDTQHKF